eukprot:CAMPEP_0197178478 /NCGR_PEP_ID=MMETSP1423-20130617/3742_1 /TAXON_ID=476441 /ORGANISM="Pseudo-nitzschia heimii, Strain UNC1101" /LENGTH=891 /DNA_ID=CAMNT_0042628227 /DNA_START=237 /DNA_END=2912 /DNA_ORIENTATION=-
MNREGSSSNSDIPSQSSSLLARALDMPSLGHGQNGNRKRVSDGYSETSSADSPRAAAPEDIGDGDKESGSNEHSTPENAKYKSATTEGFSAPLRRMSSFETPVIRNGRVQATVHPSASDPTSKEPLTMPEHGDSYNRQGSSLSSGNSSEEASHDCYRIDGVPRHSDYTVPISNVVGRSADNDGKKHAGNVEEPPLMIQSERTTTPRSIMGNIVGKKYHCSEQDRKLSYSGGKSTPKNYGSISPPRMQQQSSLTRQFKVDEHTSKQHAGDWESPKPEHDKRSSRMIPRIVPTKEYSDSDHYYDKIVDNQHIDPECQELLATRSSSSRRGFRKSIHAQSLLVGLAFMVVWLSNNIMAPNLTQMADFFGMNDAERDLYLGSYCSLALGVFSMPLSGLIGFMADFHSRKNLFLFCCVGGGLAATLSGYAQSFWVMFLARLCSGGCMSGSLPVAFSMLGDLFSKDFRSAASSGLTSMMGLGILLGQLYAGEVGPSMGWQYPFFAAAVLHLIMALLIFFLVEEPIRGGKEEALESVFESGKKYERQLPLKEFIETMYKNDSNWILLWYGFLTSLPWGVVFVFLNDFLSQEKGFSVEEATYLVMLFGVGCALGGIIGGYLGQIFSKGNRSNIPLYMAVSTFFGIFPFIALLNSNFSNHTGIRSQFYAVSAGCIASLPSVNVRPCIINVNPPESRGGALTVTNIFVALGRGIGPSCITLLASIFHYSRQTSFNVTLSLFWTISGIQLLFLAKTLPRDQDAMEAELLRYAVSTLDDDDDKRSGEIGDGGAPPTPVRDTAGPVVDAPLTPSTADRGILDYRSIISSPPAQYMTIDGTSVKESLEFVKRGIHEFGVEITLRNTDRCGSGSDAISPSGSDADVRRQVGGADSDGPENGEVLFP